MLSASSIRYEISSGNLGGVFEIDPSSGAVGLAADLDYETRKLVSIAVLSRTEQTILYRRDTLQN